MTFFFFQEDSERTGALWCNTVQLSEKCDFRVSPFCQVVQKHKLVKRLLIAYFISNISAKNIKIHSRVSKL